MVDVMGSLTTSIVETEEEPFVPGERVITAVLTPIAEEEPFEPPIEPAPEVPPPSGPVEPPPITTTYGSPVPSTAPGAISPKPVVIDIETTGFTPWDSRIIVITALPIDQPQEPVVFLNVSEDEMIRQFIQWFEGNGYNQIIGYNVSFDTRFIFTRMLKFGHQGPGFLEAVYYDMANVMQQIQQNFVYGFNKPGSLASWRQYIFNRPTPFTGKDVLKAWEDKRIDEILEHAKDDVNTTYELWLLDQYIRRNIGV